MNRDDLKKRVQEATDAVRLINEHVALRARGKEFVGLCPFHDDKNPSMTVSPAKQIFKCFSCGAGGDVFSFVMDYHKMTFSEALAHLAERANIELPRYGPQEQGPSPRQRVLTVNQQALDFYRKTLADPRSGAAARAYIAERGISDEMVNTFQLGAAPDAWDALAKTVESKRWDVQAFEQAGLIAQRNGGDGHYDKLRHRLIFPILDSLGRPIGFGGRVIPGSTRDDASDAKYLNSPETPVFNKSATLFGLHAAQKPIIDGRTAVIVEGYTDVIACHQAGVRHAVATLGTALTPEHARLLRRYCDRVVLVFDGDEAGQKAADRALAVFFTEPLDISIAVLPEGLDPGDLFDRPDGYKLWSAAIERAADAMTFQFARVRAEFQGADSLAARQRIAEEYLNKLVQLGIRQLDRQRYGLIFAQVAQLLGMSPGAVNEQLKKLSPPRAPGSGTGDATFQPPPHSVADQHSVAERHLVGALLNRPELFEAVLSDGRALSESLAADDFVDGPVRAVFLAFSEWLHEHGEMARTDFRSVFADEETLRLALDLQFQADLLAQGEPERLAEQVMHNASALLRRRAELDYEQHKLEIRQQLANDSAPGDEMRRLVGALPHLSARPATRRVPRIVGTELKP